MPKMYQNTFGGRAQRSPDRSSRNRAGPTSNGRDISIDWPQDGTTSLKYKAQRERRVPNSSHILLIENTHRILRHLGTQKGANLCLKCTKIRLLPAGLCPDPLGSLSAPADPLAAIKWSYLLTALKIVALCIFVHLPPNLTLYLPLVQIKPRELLIHALIEAIVVLTKFRLISGVLQ